MNQTNSARWVNIVLGIWLFISAFLWPHSEAQFTNTWIVGAVMAILAFAALRAPQLRFVNAAIAVWLFISAWALPGHLIGTMWNNVVVSIIAFVVAVTPGGPRHIPAAAHR